MPAIDTPERRWRGRRRAGAFLLAGGLLAIVIGVCLLGTLLVSDDDHPAGPPDPSPGTTATRTANPSPSPTDGPTPGQTPGSPVDPPAPGRTTALPPPVTRPPSDDGNTTATIIGAIGGLITALGSFATGAGALMMAWGTMRAQRTQQVVAVAVPTGGPTPENGPAPSGSGPAPTQGPPPVQPSPARLWRFNPPPGWPPAPDGWEPAPEWRPDPSWPEPPPGWPLWVPAEPRR